MQRLFIDTEFTDFINSQLISIGAITEDGKHEFYAEVSDYNRKAESQFVRANIIPLLTGGYARMPSNEVAARFGSWIEELGFDVQLCIDYKTDWDLTVDLLDGIWPKNLHGEFLNVFGDLQGACVTRCTKRDVAMTVDGSIMPEDTVPLGIALGEYHRIFQEAFLNHFFDNRITPNYKQHHALYDARANRHGWLAAMKYIKGL